MFAAAEADEQLRDDELVSIVTMKDVFKGYAESDIITLYKEYKNRFSEKSYMEISRIMVPQIPEELYMGTLAILADLIVLDFNIDMKESSFISIVASVMGHNDIVVKTLLISSLSKKLLMDVGQK